VDCAWKSLTIRDKIDGERTIPLTPYVATLLSSLPRVNEWVFSSADAEGGRLINPGRAHGKALRAAGLPHVTLHGLRRSFGTLSEWLEIPTGVVAQIQGHKPSAIAEKHYRRRPLDLLRLWHTKLEAWILEQGRVPFGRHNPDSERRITRVAAGLKRHFGREELHRLADELTRGPLALVNADGSLRNV
jgi:integrase